MGATGRSDADAAGRLRSEVLGLDLHLHVRAGELRFRDPATGEDLRYADESEDGRVAEKNRADAAERERAAERDRADAERGRADAAERGRAAEKNRADAESDRADAEKRRADAAERELARLRLGLDGS